MITDMTKNMEMTSLLQISAFAEVILRELSKEVKEESWIARESDST